MHLQIYGSENIKEIKYLADLRVDGTRVLKWIVKILVEEVLNYFIWLSIGASLTF